MVPDTRCELHPGFKKIILRNVAFICSEAVKGRRTTTRRIRPELEIVFSLVFSLLGDDALNRI